MGIRNSIIQFFIKSTYVFLLVLGVVVALGVGLFYSVTSIEDDIVHNRTFNVEGKASRDVPLDTASVTMGVILKGESPVDLQEEAREKYNNAIEKIKAIGISENDIKTQGYNVSSTYNRETGEINGYQVNLTIRVTISGTSPEDEKPGEVIAAASESGFNEIRNLNFYLDDYDSVRDEIKAEAIEDAKQRAEREADLAGLNLGKLLNMSDGYDYYPYYERGFAELDSVALSEAAPEPAGLPEIKFNPGETEVSVSVNLIYEIK